MKNYFEHMLVGIFSEDTFNVLKIQILSLFFLMAGAFYITSISFYEFSLLTVSAIVYAFSGYIFAKILLLTAKYIFNITKAER